AGAVARARRAVAAAPRRAPQHAIATLEHGRVAGVPAPPVDAHVAAPSGRTTGQAGGGEGGALGHDAEHDGPRRAALDEDVLAESATETSPSPRARAH